jgi:protein O-GlcNAc transferase
MAAFHLGEIVRMRPDSAEARCELGALLVECDRIDAAIFHLRAAVRLAPAHAPAHHNLAVALAHAGALDEALATAEIAARLAPSDSQTVGFRDHLRGLRRR